MGLLRGPLHMPFMLMRFTAAIVCACVSLFCSTASLAAECAHQHFAKRMKDKHAIALRPGCTGDTPLVDFSFPVFKDPLKNHGIPRKRAVRYVIIHYTDGGIEGTLKWFATGKEPRVSAHYCITQKEGGLVRGGVVVQCVPEKECARHAGISEFHEAAKTAGLEGTPVTEGGSGLNHLSIGIELVNLGDSCGSFCPFDPDQIEKLGALCQYLQRKYNLEPIHFLGHSDVSFRNKPDPGPLFPWEYLYERFGIGAWLSKAERSACAQEDRQRELNPIEIKLLSKLLVRYGYDLRTSDPSEEEFQKALFAFRAHFSCNQRPDLCVLGRPPDLNDLLWIQGLVKKYVP